MKLFKSILLLLIVGSHFCKAQDTKVLLSPTMFEKSRQAIFLSAMDGWRFKEGHDTSWAKKDIDTTGWKIFKPTELSAKMADKNGKVEGWFRIKIKPDAAFGNMLLGIKMSTWAATDLYLDGNFITAFGNTGQNGKPYKENQVYLNFPVPVNLKAGYEYTIAIHFVDHLSPYSPKQLKSEIGANGLLELIKITGPKYNVDLFYFMMEFTLYSTIWIMLGTVLSLLFWLLSIQNPSEKNLRLIALFCTFLALTAFFMTLRTETKIITFDRYSQYSYAFGIFLILTLTMIPLILVDIFNRKASRGLMVFLFLFCLAMIIELFLTINFIFNVFFIALLFICSYYILTSWKKLKGAQWAVIAGLLIYLIWGLLFGYLRSKYAGYPSPFPYFYLCITGIFVSFPLSLLIYVAIRFMEIIKEVQQNAKQVVQLSEEKKEQVLNQQKILQEEVNRQTAEIRTTLDNLKSTQSQLIQSEKMASLGELTAGIAHEIQNPLNFVNNFSEVNEELLAEMKDELDKGNIEDAKALASDAIGNQQKILIHGKRADAIVKGMLQHSRSSSGVKEPTNINALADEYLRLAYHGLRVKDKSFNTTMKTDFDETIGKINIIPQDIGRVILNLINNAFYAVNEKAKVEGEAYQPTVTVSTKLIIPPAGGMRGALISVRDNGPGIPAKLLDKIFQPFFTTKPSGQGTGLGLSLSYDIVKAHGGELKVETNENKGTEFIITIPKN